MSNTSKKHGLTITIENACHDIFWYEDDNGNVFFNATAIWKAAKSNPIRRPVDYQLTEGGQTLIVEQYRKLINGLTVQPLNGTVTVQFTDGSFDPDTWVFVPRKPLPDEVLSHFVHTTKGRSGGTFMIELVAMDYAQWVSVQVKDEILRTYRTFGSVNRAIEEGRTEDAVAALGKAANNVIEKEYEAAGVAVNPAKIQARRDNIEKRRAFTDVVESIYGKGNPMFAKAIAIISDAANIACFGVMSEDMKRGLHTSGSPRACMSTAALQAITVAESALLTGIEHGNLKTVDDMVRELERLSPMLKMLANTMGAAPVVMENTRVRGGVGVIGTHQGIMPAGEQKVGFVAKQITHQI